MKYFFTIFSCIFLFSIQLSKAQVTLTAESGLSLNGYNNVRYFNEEGNQGDLFSLTDDFGGQKAAIYARIELKWQFFDRNIIELTAAPLAFEYSGLKRNSLNFGQNTYSQIGAQTTARYEFNTYRASYRYQFIDTDKWQLSGGASVLIRDARIAVAQGNLLEETTDLGIVPLLSFDLSYLCSDRLTFILKGDALVGPVGRAEDVLLGATYQLGVDNLKLRAGYRIIEGGADVSQVYNFSLIHFAAVGLSYSF
jgi:hypothetical protein